MDFLNNMTVLNWIGIGVTVALLIVGIVLKIKSKKKVDDLDGFCGIIPKGDTDKTDK